MKFNQGSDLLALLTADSSGSNKLSELDIVFEHNSDPAALREIFEALGSELLMNKLPAIRAIDLSALFWSADPEEDLSLDALSRLLQNSTCVPGLFISFPQQITDMEFEGLVAALERGNTVSGLSLLFKGSCITDVGLSHWNRLIQNGCCPENFSLVFVLNGLSAITVEGFQSWADAIRHRKCPEGFTWGMIQHGGESPVHESGAHILADLFRDGGLPDGSMIHFKSPLISEQGFNVIASALEEAWLTGRCPAGLKIYLPLSNGVESRIEEISNRAESLRLMECLMGFEEGCAQFLGDEKPPVFRPTRVISEMLGVDSCVPLYRTVRERLSDQKNQNASKKPLHVLKKIV